MSFQGRLSKKSDTLMSFVENIEGTMAQETTTLAHDATLQALLDSNTILRHLEDERSMVREILGEQSLAGDVKETTTSERRETAYEPLMSLKATTPLIKQTKSTNGNSNSASVKKSGVAINAAEKDNVRVKSGENRTMENGAASASPALNRSRDEREKTPTASVEGSIDDKASKKPSLTQRALRPPAKVKRIAESASSQYSKRKPESSKDIADLQRNRARKAALSAFMHLHHPSMTEAEQKIFLQKYDGRDHEMWAYLASKFGENSVPERLRLSAEEIRGSMRVHLHPKLDTEAGKKVMKAMEIWGIDPKGKEMVRRSTTVDELIKILQLRWEPLDDKFQGLGHVLRLYEIDSSEPLPGQAVVRDHVNDARLEFCWTPASPNDIIDESNPDAAVNEANPSVVDTEDSWGQEHSLAAYPQTAVEMTKPAHETTQKSLLQAVNVTSSYMAVPSGQQATSCSPELSKQNSKSSPSSANEPTKKRRIQPIPISTNKRILADEATS